MEGAHFGYRLTDGVVYLKHVCFCGGQFLSERNYDRHCLNLFTLVVPHPAVWQNLREDLVTDLFNIKAHTIRLGSRPQLGLNHRIRGRK